VGTQNEYLQAEGKEVQARNSVGQPVVEMAEDSGRAKILTGPKALSAWLWILPVPLRPSRRNILLRL